MKYTITFVILLIAIPLAAQVQLQGYITDNTGEAAIGANVIIKGTYNGASTDVEGFYQLEVSHSDTLVFSYLGYKDEVFAVPTTNETSFQKDIRLEPIVNLLAQATISGHKTREIVRLSSRQFDQMQVFTTAGDPGNILLAAQGGASASINPANGRLLARGGRAHETQFYMDGMLLGSPYINTIAGVNTRLRQNPFMIEEVDMYNGTASAEYGQALSSVFSMKTRQRIRDNELSISSSTVGVNANVAQKVGKGGFIYNLDYLNLFLNNLLTVNNVDWIRPYQSINNQLLWELPLNDDRQIRLYASHNKGSMRLNSWYENNERDITLIGDQVNVSFNYKQIIGTQWDWNVSAMYQSENSQTGILNLLNQDAGSDGMHTKVVARHFAKNDLTLKTGCELFHSKHRENVAFDEEQMEVNNNLTYTNLVFFAEAEKQWTEKFTSRVGIRGDDLNETKPTLTARALAGYQFTPELSLTASWGTFTQVAPVGYRYYNRGLRNEYSEQIIATLVHEKNARKASLSLFNKKYDDLSVAPVNYPFYPMEINANGWGYARGLDITWEDKKTIKGGDIFFSYAWINSERNDGDYVGMMIPDYLYPHQVNLRVQRFIPSISSNISLSAVWMGGKVLDNPWTNDIIERDNVEAFRNLSINYTYITRLLGAHLTYLHLSVDNILNIDNEVGLQYPAPTQVISQKANTGRSLFLAIISNF
ncbi:MAG: TonB-dependent receptor [Saprospiraceae bacterium]